MNQACCKGGLKMLNVYTFLSSLKISWLRRILQQPSVFEHISIFHPETVKISKLGSEYTHKLMQNTQNAFWHDVFKHYLKLCTKCSIDNVHAFNAECIFYNRNIKIGNHTVYHQRWLQ